MTPTHRNNAPEMRPCETICTIAPVIPMPAPCTAPVLATMSYTRNEPSVTKPMCAIDEYAISFFMSVCTNATKPM